MNIEAINLLDELRHKRKTPKNMEYFYDVLESVYNSEKEPVFKKFNKKLIGTYCILVSEELIYAVDALPVRLCGGSYETSLAAEEHFPAGSCSLMKSSYGAFRSDEFPWVEEIKALVAPATCDWKKKFNDLDLDKPVHMMNVPFSKKRDSAGKAWLEEVYELKRFLESQTKKRITTGSLMKAIEHVQKAHLEFRRLYELRKKKPSVISGVDSVIALNAYFFDDAAQWAKAMSALADELEERVRAEEAVCRKSTPRILVTGSPIIFPNMKIVSLIEESGGVVAIDDLCSSTRSILSMMRWLLTREICLTL